MTKKEAEKYYQNEANWRVVSEVHHVRMLLLDYQNLHYAKVQVRDYRNYYLQGINPVHYPIVDWKDAGLYEYDPETDAVVYGVSMSHIINEIWNTSRGKA